MDQINLQNQIIYDGNAHFVNLMQSLLSLKR